MGWTAATHRPLAEHLWPQAQSRAIRWAQEALWVLGGSWLVALMAQVRLPLPFTPVPITGQTFGVLLMGFALGARRGFLCLALYLLQGGMGLPFFAGGASGWGHLLGPTGGYLWGFVGAAALMGWLAERGWDRSFLRTLAGMGLGNLLIYLFGLPWLAAFVGWERVWLQGLLPFLPGDALKALGAALLLPSLWRGMRE